MEHIYLRYKIQLYSFVVFFVLSCISMIILIDSTKFSIVENITFVDKKTDTQSTHNNRENLQNNGHKNHGYIVQSTSNIGYQKEHENENQQKYINENYKKYEKGNEKNVKIHNFIEYKKHTKTYGREIQNNQISQIDKNGNTNSKNFSRSYKNAKNSSKIHKLNDENGSNDENNSKNHSNDSKNIKKQYELPNKDIQREQWIQKIQEILGLQTDQNLQIKKTNHMDRGIQSSKEFQQFQRIKGDQDIQETLMNQQDQVKNGSPQNRQKHIHQRQSSTSQKIMPTKIQEFRSNSDQQNSVQKNAKQGNTNQKIPNQLITSQQYNASIQPISSHQKNLTNHSQQNTPNRTNNTSLYIKSGKINELQREIRKIFKTQEPIPQWVIKSINENTPRRVQKNNLCTLQYSKSSNSAIIHIDESSFYIEVQEYGKKLLFTKKMFETKKITKVLKVEGNALSLLQQAEVPLKDATSILNVLKNICKIKDIYSNSIRAKIYIKFNIIYDSIKNTTNNNISKITIVNESYSYSIYGFRNSIKNGTYYNKDGICLVWNNTSLPMKTFTLNSNYGRRLHPVLKVYKFHHGIDFVGPKYSKIYSICPGKVIKKQKIGTFGNCIFIQSPDTKKTFIYAHMNSLAPNIEVGMFVEMNQPIGTIGETGRTTGEHLHLEIRNSNGESENPTEIFEHLGKKLKGERLSEFLSSISEHSN